MFRPRRCPCNRWHDASGACAASTAGSPSALFSALHAFSNEQAAVNGLVGHAHALVVGILEPSITRQSVWATSPASVYSQPGHATRCSRKADSVSAARLRSRLAGPHHKRDRQVGHHGARTSRLTPPAHQPTEDELAISRIDKPEAIPRECLLARPDVSASRERRRATGGMPPRGSNTARIALCDTSRRSARFHAASVRPSIDSKRQVYQSQKAQAFLVP